MDFAVILVETLGIVGHPVENDELGHWYLLWSSVKLGDNRIDELRDVVNKAAVVRHVFDCGNFVESGFSHGPRLEIPDGGRMHVRADFLGCGCTNGKPCGTARLAKLASDYRLAHSQDLPKAAARRTKRLWQA